MTQEAEILGIIYITVTSDGNANVQSNFSSEATIDILKHVASAEPSEIQEGEVEDVIEEE